MLIQALLSSDPRPLDAHAWLDGLAYRPTKIDPDGLSLTFELYSPGHTEAEEKAKNDVYAPDRNAPRASTPMVFEMVQSGEMVGDPVADDSRPR